ncbi:MAG: NfeD family protein [Rikenellaceae bacterium]
MSILVILLLVLLGLLFCIVELLILPGITLGGILSMVCYGAAAYMSFNELGVAWGIIVVSIIIVLSLVAIAFSLRAKTWDRFSLKSKIDSSSSVMPQDKVKIGERGVALSRLSPMGKVLINGCSYEAKSNDVYIDAKSDVEVVGFENFSVVVAQIK